MSIEQFAFVAILLLVIIITGCSMLYLLLKNTRFTGGPGGNASAGDVTNLMILFQSMRETVEQQKELARQFNVSIDRKVASVREALGTSANLKEQVEQARAEIDALMKDTKEQLASLNRRMEYLVEKAPEGLSIGDDAVNAVATEVAQVEVEVEAVAELAAEAVSAAEVVEVEAAIDDVPDAPIDSVPEPVVEEPEPRRIQSTYDGSEKLPPLHAIASSAPKRSDFIDNWSGVDFGFQELEEPAHVPEPTEPEDPEGARDAFRTLLNLKQTETNGDFTSSGGLVSDDSITPVQRRIYEFSDAGMRVPDIARELGVGKGEVKLILNMRDSQA